MYRHIDDILRQRVMILDGAMGTVIQEYGLGEYHFWNDDLRKSLNRQHTILLKGNNDVLNLTRPDVIADIHERYLKAGADIITTNTFNAQRISQADYGLQCFVRQMNLTGARLARQAADKYATHDKPRFVAGSIGPTNKTCSMSPDVSDPGRRDLTYDELFDAYLEQVMALLEGGVDLLLIETIFDTLNARAAIDAAQQATRENPRPIMLSLTISDAAGRTLSGQTMEAFLASVSSYNIFSVGLNCSFGADKMKPYLQQLATCAPYFVSAHPNAGLPNSMGLYDETPESMAPRIAEFINERLVNIIGGCCGTTPAFIERYAPLVKNQNPRVPVQKSQNMMLSGLELLEVIAPTFITVGERCNVAGSRKFLRLIKEKNYDEALRIARKQVEDGAMIIDINMDDALLDAKTEMVHFLNLIASEPDIARVPVMIDSSKWEVIMAGLKCMQGKAIVNSISLKEGEEIFLSHAHDILRMGAAVVVMCFDEQGQATTYKRRIDIAARSYRLLTQIGFPPQDIIFDPNILAIGTGMEEHNAYAIDYIRAAKWIRTHLKGAHVSGGVSNLSFAFRGNNYLREAMHAVFLHYAMEAGMDFGIVNPSTRVAYNDILKSQLKLLEDFVLNRRPDAAERLVEMASSDEAFAQNVPTVSAVHSPLESRLQEALIRGNADTLEGDLREALEKYPTAVSIIEGPLMAGMNEVGRRFGEGSMYLPQVVKTARTMKQAVEILTAISDLNEKVESTKTGKILLATVKGDVHDIGKNIVSVIMACNGYEVIDLGVMVPAEQIVQKAKEEKVDMIGLSGLITPSLDEMVNVAKELKRAEIDIPIMIGGATTSELHVALKIAPVYSGPVVWMKDASQNPIMAQRLMSESTQVAQELHNHYAHMRELYMQKQQQLLSLDEARRNKLKLF